MTHPNDSFNSIVVPTFMYRDGSCLGPSVQEYGLTKREYFAAMAMQGFLSSCSSESVPDAEMIAIESVKYADALINELNKKP